MKERGLLVGYMVLAVAIALTIVFARVQFDRAIAHSDHNRCLQSQHVWDVADEFRRDVFKPPPPLTAEQHAIDTSGLIEQRHEAVVATDKQNDATIKAKLGSRPTCTKGT